MGTAPPRRTLKEILAQVDRDLGAPDTDEITKNHKLAELQNQVQEVRQRQQSAPEIHVHTAPAAPSKAPDSTPAEIKMAWKHRGLVMKALPWVLALIGATAGGERLLRAVGVIR